MLYCFEPGFHALCMEILHYSNEEMNYQLSSWKEYVSDHIPSFYADMCDIIEKQKAEGGLVCVVSHSCKENIERDYQIHCSIMPDMIFGWELGENQRKPHPYPLEQIMKTYQLSPKDLLMVDDLKPGLDMARSCEVDFACAGWSHQQETITAYMKKNCTTYLSKVNELSHLLF
jgi:phosphoglycolate phosphatase/pyrophosphatase PpaX